MDRLSSMAIFVRAVDTGSFAATAGALGLSAPMVGRHIRLLEDHLGAQLLNRTTRRQSLTEIGQVFYDRCRSVLAEVEAAEACAAELGASPRGRLRIDAPVTFGEHCVAPALPEYLARYPHVRVELTLNNRLVDLVEEGFDAVIRMGGLSDSGLVAKPLAPFRLIACASPEYLARCGSPDSPGDLEHHACLGFHPGSLEDLWTFLDSNGRELAQRVFGPLSSNNGLVLRAAAVAGVGIILQPEAMLADDLASGRLRSILPVHTPRPTPTHILFAPGRPPTPKLRSFLDFASARFGR